MHAEPTKPRPVSAFRSWHNHMRADHPKLWHPIRITIVVITVWWILFCLVLAPTDNPAARYRLDHHRNRGAAAVTVLSEIDVAAVSDHEPVGTLAHTRSRRQFAAGNPLHVRHARLRNQQPCGAAAARLFQATSCSVNWSSARATAIPWPSSPWSAWYSTPASSPRWNATMTASRAEAEQAKTRLRRWKAATTSRKPYTTP